MASLNQIIHKKNKTSRSFAKNKKKKIPPLALYPFRFKGTENFMMRTSL